MIYGNVGRRELGKTTLALYLIRNYPMRVILDPRGLVPAESPRVTTHAGIGLAFDALHEQGRGEIVVTPDADVQGAFDQLACEVRDAIVARQERIAFLVDEARFVKLEDSEAFKWILRCAPRDRTAIVISAHRPIDIHGNVRSIMDQWCLFQMTHPADLDGIEDLMNARVRAVLPTLKPYEFVNWDDTVGKMTVIKNPAQWYRPLGASRGAASSELADLGGTLDKDDRLF